MGKVPKKQIRKTLETKRQARKKRENKGRHSHFYPEYVQGWLYGVEGGWEGYLFVLFWV